MDWEDCVGFLVSEGGDDDDDDEEGEGDSDAKYERFASVTGAVRYLLEADDEAGSEKIGGGVEDAKKAKAGKRPRGGPRKVAAEAVVEASAVAAEDATTSATKRRRGRPKKSGVGIDGGGEAEADDERGGEDGGRPKPRKRRRASGAVRGGGETKRDATDDASDEAENETSMAEAKKTHRNGGTAATKQGRKEKDPTPGEAWMGLFERLKRFKEVHGHLDIPPVPAAPRTNPALLPAAPADVDPVAPADVGAENFGETLEVPNAPMATAGAAAPPPAPNNDEEEHADLRRFLEQERARHCQRSHTSFKPSSVTREKVRLLKSLGVDLGSPLTSKLTQKWERNFDKLKAYHAEHGHTMVPSKKHELGTWVHIQRREYRKLRAGEKSRLTFDRMRRLSDLGFVWIVRKKDYTTWDERIQQLREFLEAHGHLKVPVSHPILGDFVSHTRNGYAKLLSGRPTSLTKEKVSQLESIGFVFLAGKRLGERRGPNRTWEERFRDLEAFKERHGHVVVPQAYREDPSLGEWVHKQRRMYKQLRKGETNNNALTPERAFRLTELGFVFDAVKHRGSTFA